MTGYSQTIFAIVLVLLTAAPSVAQSEKQRNKPLDYQVRRVIRSTKKGGYTLITVRVNAKHLNRKDMTTLAEQLREEFAEETRLNAALFDESTPDYILTRGGEIMDFYAEQRGLYSVDRSKCKEHIEYYAKKGNAKRKIMITFGCASELNRNRRVG
jgi:hypothetical protein